MHPEAPRANILGFTHMTSIMALCAKPTHLGGAVKFR